MICESCFPARVVTEYMVTGIDAVECLDCIARREAADVVKVARMMGQRNAAATPKRARLVDDLEV